MWQSDYVETGSIKLHYTRTGGDKPTLIMAHGITDNGLCWTDVAKVLETDYDIIMYDARGHGLSGAPETGYDRLQRAEDLHGLIQGLELGKPLILGHSMGAMTALTFAGQYPDIPKALLLEDPPDWWMPQTEDDAQRGAGIFEWIKSLKDKSREELLAGQREATPHWSETELENWADSKVQLSQNILNAEDVEINWRDLISKITCPVLLITGDTEAGAIVSPEAAVKFQTYVPQAKVEQLEGAGHSIRRDKFDDYMKEVQDFLKSV